MSEGLNRHEAIHAIGSVLSQALFTAMNEPSVDGDLGGDYLEQIENFVYGILEAVGPLGRRRPEVFH